MTDLEKDMDVNCDGNCTSDSSRIHCFNNHCLNGYGPG